MIGLAARRLSHWWTWGFVAFGLFFTHYISSLALVRTNFVSGLILFSMLLLLALYNLRKKIPSLPLGTSAGWLTFHVFSGLLTMVVFFLHIGFRLPNGYLESLLGLVYFFVVLSGLVGLAFSKILPKRLSTRGDEVLFERIPILQKKIREEAETIVEQTGSVALGEVYMTRLFPFFEKTKFRWGHLLESKGHRQALIADLRATHRFLGSNGRESAKQLERLIEEKDDIDYKETLQGVLKYWLFVHIPLTYGLLILSVVHAALAYMYSENIF